MNTTFLEGPSVLIFYCRIKKKDILNFIENDAIGKRFHASPIMTHDDKKLYQIFLQKLDMEFIAKLCDPVIVMAEGAVLAEGSAGEIKKNNSVIEAYLGTGQKNRKVVT